jgi:hypothetical protein
MTILSFLITVLYWPYFVAPANNPKWVVLSAVIPLILMFRTVPWSRAHTVGMAWLLWAAVTIFWATSTPDAFMRLWQFILAGGIFAIGSTLTERQIRNCLLAFCVGVSVNAVVGILQATEWLDPLFMVGDIPFPFHATPVAGLQVNGNYMAEMGLVAFVAAVCGLSTKELPKKTRVLWIMLIPLILVTLFLPQSKGAVAAFMMVGVVWLWPRVRWLSTTLLAAGILAALSYIAYFGLDHWSLAPRIGLFSNSFVSITVFGYGIGSFWSTYPLFYDAAITSSEHVYHFSTGPRTAHNDFLTMGVETGIVGLILLGWFFMEVLKRRDDVAWYVVVSFLALGVFNFPAYVPTTLFMAALCAGFLCRPRNDLRAGRHTRGLSIQ